MPSTTTIYMSSLPPVHDFEDDPNILSSSQISHSANPSSGYTGWRGRKGACVVAGEVEGPGFSNILPPNKDASCPFSRQTRGFRFMDPKAENSEDSFDVTARMSYTTGI